MRVLKKTGGEKKMHSVFEVFFCVDVNLEDKASRVVGEKSDSSSDFSPVFKDKFTSI